MLDRHYRSNKFGYDFIHVRRRIGKASLQNELIAGAFNFLKLIHNQESKKKQKLQTYDSKDLYPTLIEKAARLCYALNKNHPFIDGNKRVSMHMLAVFLRFHDIDYMPTNSEVIRVELSLANGSISYEDLFVWLKRIT